MDKINTPPAEATNAAFQTFCDALTACVPNPDKRMALYAAAHGWMKVAVREAESKQKA